mgnify:CR=1 FL=1
MEMKKLFFCLLAIVALSLAACGNKSRGVLDWATQDTPRNDSLSAEAAADGKHTAEYITLRIDSIYKLRTDSLCCTERYLALDREAAKISKAEGLVYLDADHWVQGQDIADDWSYDMVSVENITDSTAQVRMNIHNYSDQTVVLDLRFERNDWYVDNFHAFYEAPDYDEDGNAIPGTEGMKELDELKEIQRFIDEAQTNHSTGGEIVSRRSLLEEAERVTIKDLDEPASNTDEEDEEE